MRNMGFQRNLYVAMAGLTQAIYNKENKQSALASDTTVQSNIVDIYSSIQGLRDGQNAAGATADFKAAGQVLSENGYTDLAAKLGYLLTT